MAMTILGSAACPLRVAVVGSGPSGFYAAEALLQSELKLTVDIIERLPTPYGLVRYGVAPDHPKLKEVVQVFARIARHEACSFIGNTTVGRDVSMRSLGELYHVVVVAAGASRDRHLGIPGEHLAGVHSATDFVGWYNGHPDCAHLKFDLSQETAVVIGQGNVALDVCRILAKSVDELRHTDIAPHALDTLATSRVREIHLVGRRGPVQAKFSPKELRELGHLEHCSAAVDERDLTLSNACLVELKDPHADAAAKNLQLLRDFAQATQVKTKQCRVRFLLTPLEIQGDAQVRRVVFGRNELCGPAFEQQARCTDRRIELDAGLVLRSVGYRSEPFDMLPFDKARGLIPHIEGRVACEDITDARVYVTGWIKRGPTGIIGTNRADSVASVQTLLSDLPFMTPAPKPGGSALREHLSSRGQRPTDWSDWERIDMVERERGIAAGRSREKLVRVDDMLAAAGPRG
jgi:ferredoxin--NADP+ reductase